MLGTERRGKKRTYVSISSSSSGDRDEGDDLIEEESGAESESREQGDNDDDYDEAEETSVSSSSNDDGEDDDSWSEWSDEKVDDLDDQEDGECSDLDNDESLCNKVIGLLRETCDLQKLNLRECKSYLRQHGLRITGTKVECVQRIMEHWRIKEGNAEALYPRSSFVINCTGDVCKGDVVLFTQSVYKKFDKVTRRGSFLGKRTIAGRVVKESYGAAKQQHTFTIEVLWSQGLKTLPPLFPLLVKGRNLYKLKTFRQCWKNEADRLEVLEEKHKRGAAARQVRAMKKMWKACSKNGGVKRQKRFHHARASQTGSKAEPRKGEHSDGCGKAAVDPVKFVNHRQKDRTAYRKRISGPGVPKSSKKHQNLTYSSKSGGSIKSHPHPSQNLLQPKMPVHHSHHWSAPLQIPSYGGGYALSEMRFPHFRPFVDSSVMPVSHGQSFNQVSYPPRAYSYPGRVFEPRNLGRSSELMNIYVLSKPFSSGRETYGQGRRGF